MCFGSAPTGTKYLISAERVGFTFLNRKLSGTITEGNQVAELTAYPRASGKSTAKKTKKKKLRAKRTSRR
jgi:hypothetical protein